MMPVAIADCGDSSLRLTATSGDPEQNWELVHHVARWFTAKPGSAVHCVVPTYDSLLIEFDMVRADHDGVRGQVRLAVSEFAGRGAPRESRRLSVPVVYGGAFGPDLPAVAAFLGITEQDVIDLHAGRTYTIRCLGGPVGSPMTDGPAFATPIPRLDSPRPAVAAGHVSVAGRQATIAPAQAPGGWPLLGRTPLRILDIESDELVPYRPGDRITYFAIDADEWDSYAGQRLRALP